MLQRERVAPNTFRRVVKQNELLGPDAGVESKRRSAFAKAHANELWQADTMVGPYVQQGAGKVQAKLIAFLDDASRVVCHGEFFVSDNTEALLKSFRTALYKRGLCEVLYVDHGSKYSSLELSQVCQRIGTILCHAPVRDGAAKGKVERFFRTVRESFLTQKLDLSSLDALNRAFFAWLEDDYHQREHRSLGMKPIDRFGLDLSRIRYPSPGEVSDELFFIGQERRCERRLIEEARRLNAAGKMLAPVIDDALLGRMSLTVNEDIKSRVTYSVLLQKLAPDALTDFIKSELDKVAPAHSTFTDDALSLIVRSAEGGLRRAKNLCLAALLDAVRDRTNTVDLKHLNRVLLQPHWRHYEAAFPEGMSAALEGRNGPGGAAAAAGGAA